MSEMIVELPYKYYPDPTRDKPVYLGSIFIGEPDTDPEIEINQKAVTISEGCLAGGVVIEQPILTSAGGVPVYNGSPVSLLTDGEYSIKVLNNKGEQVYYNGCSTNPLRDDLKTTIETEHLVVSAFQTVIPVSAAPDYLVLVINGETQEQTTDIGTPRAYSYDPSTGLITLSEPLIGNEVVFVNYGNMVSITRKDIEGILYFNTALAAVADLELEPGDTVQTGGYTFSGDYGASLYTVKTPVQYGGVPDGKKDLLIDNGNILASAESSFNVVQLGAVAGDISVDNSAIVIACAQANTDGIARLPLGEFFFYDPILYPDDFRGIIGASKEESKLHWIKTDEGDYGFRAENPTTCKLYHLEKFTIRGSSFDDGQLLCKIDRIQYGRMSEVIFNAAHALCDLNDNSFALDIDNCRFGGLDGGTPVVGSRGLILRQNPNGVNVSNCHFYRMDLLVDAKQAFSTNFTGGCVFENGNRAFDFYNAQKLVISGCYFENIYDTHFTFKGSSVTPKVLVQDNYFVFSEVGEANAIVKVDAGAANSKQLVMQGNNFRLQNADVLTSGYIIDITGAGAPLVVWWWNNDIYSNNLSTVLAKAHNMDSPRFIGDIPSYTATLSTDWTVYDEGALLNEGPLRVYMDDSTRKPYIKQDIKYVGASGTDTTFVITSLPSAFKNAGVTAGVPIVTSDISDFGVGKVRLTNEVDIQVIRGDIPDLTNQTFNVDLQWANEFNRTDPEER